MMTVKELEAGIGYSFADPVLLETALTHSSWAHEHQSRQDNERLEFLGDAVLELCSSHWLFGHFPKEAEGTLSRKRSAIVCEASLAACARRIGLGKHLLLGNGEQKSGGRDRDSLLSDAFEAVIGAVYLDGGFEAARDFVYAFVMSGAEHGPAAVDAKTVLQELLQKDGEIAIVYRQTDMSGPDHDRQFTVVVEADGKLLGEGTGRSKKQAEQAAASMALKKLGTGAHPAAEEENACI